MMDDKTEPQRVMTERQDMYQFLASVYRKEVDQELLIAMGRMDCLINTGVFEIDHGLELLSHYLGACNQATLTELATDYARIFLGIGSGQAGGAFPFESVYTSPRGLLMQEARDEVVGLYRQDGIQCCADFHNSEDHLALELEFMAYLCSKTVQALEDQDEQAIAAAFQEQNSFLGKHLLNWVPRWCEDVERIATTDFYKGMALITAGYLVIDNHLVADLLLAPQAA